MDELKGKTVLVSGATQGIGKVTALELAKMGGELVLVGRNPFRTRQIVEQIKEVSGNPAVDGLDAELSSMQEVRQLAQEFRHKYPHLHVLVNNAGGIFARRKLTVDGYEWTFALNHLAYFLLTNLLLDRLTASAPAHFPPVLSRPVQPE